MIFVSYVGSKEVSIETERPIVCCLVGQRDESTAIPDELRRFMGVIHMGKKPEGYVEPTKEEQADIARYDRDRRAGKFEPRVLNWFESENDAELDKINWPDRINFRIMPISATFA